MTSLDFRSLRLALGLTQDELAAILDLSERQIIRYEAGKAPIPRTVEMAMKQLRVQKGEQ